VKIEKAGRSGKHDIKGDIVRISYRRGALVGAVFSHVRAASAALPAAPFTSSPQGKDSELPAQTGMLIRMDNTSACR